MPPGLYRKPGKGLEKFLGQLELEIMEIVWNRGTATVTEVQAALNQQDHELAYTTVMTVLARLAEKGWLMAEKQGRAFSYRATHSRQVAEAQAVGGVLRALLQDFGEVAVAQFVKELDEIAPEQMTRLAQLLQEMEQDDEQA